MYPYLRIKNIISCHDYDHSAFSLEYEDGGTSHILSRITGIQLINNELIEIRKDEIKISTAKILLKMILSFAMGKGKYDLSVKELQEPVIYYEQNVISVRYDDKTEGEWHLEVTYADKSTQLKSPEDFARKLNRQFKKNRKGIRKYNAIRLIIDDFIDEIIEIRSHEELKEQLHILNSHRRIKCDGSD